MAKIKEKVVAFWEDHKAGVVSGVFTITMLIAYLAYVKRNTVDLPKVDISDGSCLQFYEQFGSKILDGTVKLHGSGKFMEKLIADGNFSDNAEVFFSIVEDI